MKSKFKKDEKIALIGGGNPRNFFHIVILREMREDSDARAVLETDGKKLPNPFEPFVTPEVEALPMAGSTWSLMKLPKELQDLPLGQYCINGSQILDISNIGYFGSILNGKVVKTLPIKQ